ncbi:hypothetical protein Afil01_12020 [Actinorhabdospora filicis]|uniref:Uncharacterized protein n=1 Tax=Actinorhabdospora filicis TaxID=1785913 RepID=A0A9W6SI47_9ACTN|nr:hypothetical protein [Actinorhabdospora filicis]GLZ76395.1 hypothetical protein Afil01_12020 [Actinorhabdospora filicis]
MAGAWVRRGVNPDDPGEAVLVVTIDPGNSPGEALAAGMGDWGHEGDGAFYIVRTDGWIATRLDGTSLTAEVHIAEHYVREQDADPAGYPPSPGGYLRVATATGEADPALYAEAAEGGIVVFHAPHGSTFEEAMARQDPEEDWPLIWAPPPPPGELAGE